MTFVYPRQWYQSSEVTRLTSESATGLNILYPPLDSVVTFFGPLIHVDDLPGRQPLFYQHQPPCGTASQTANSRQPTL